LTLFPSGGNLPARFERGLLRTRPPDEHGDSDSDSDDDQPGGAGDKPRHPSGRAPRSPGSLSWNPDATGHGHDGWLIHLLVTDLRGVRGRTRDGGPIDRNGRGVAGGSYPFADG